MSDATPASAASKLGLGSRFAGLAGASTLMTLLVVLAALLAVFGLIIGDKLFTPEALRSMAFQIPELGILSLAMMIALLSGGLNLSIIATANLCALAMAFVLTRYAPEAFGPAQLGVIALAMLAGLAVAAVIGLVNGFVIAYLGVSPILATLGTMTLCKGLAIGATHGNVLSGFPEAFTALGNGVIFGGTVYAVPISLLIFLGCAIPFGIMLNRTPFGAKIYMIGSNEMATRFSGVDTRAVVLRLYVVSSLLAAVAAIVMMAHLNSANASYGESYLLVTILAAVLGGVDPFGGFGKVGGLILSLVILQVISSAFNVMGFSQFLTLAIWGGTLILVTAVPHLRSLLRR